MHIQDYAASLRQVADYALDSYTNTFELDPGRIATNIKIMKYEVRHFTEIAANMGKLFVAGMKPTMGNQKLFAHTLHKLYYKSLGAAAQAFFPNAGKFKNAAWFEITQESQVQPLKFLDGTIVTVDLVRLMYIDP